MKMSKHSCATISSALLVLSSFSTAAFAAGNVNFDRLAQAADQEALDLRPLFNFTNVSCLPSPAISNTTAEQNGGLKPKGSLTGGCQRDVQIHPIDDKAGSNTYYRKQCVQEGDSKYCVHMYALYFLKDQAGTGGAQSGHRHDWEFAILWTTNGILTDVGHSSHGDVKSLSASQAVFSDAETRHARFVYGQQGALTHSMYFYQASNSGNFYNETPVTPTIVDWYQMKGLGSVDNALLRKQFNAFDYGSANCSFNDSNFPREITKSIPDGYPAKQQWLDAFAESAK